MKTSYDLTIVKSALAISYSAEFAGRYEEGLEELSFFWDYTRPNHLPNLDSFPKEITAKLLLRVAVLYGFYGNSIKNAQEVSKNLLTRALESFAANDLENQAICSNYLSYTYCRMGELQEAKTWVSNALSLCNKSGVFLQSIIAESNIAFSESKYQENFDRLISNQLWFTNSNHTYYKALFYNHLGLVKKNLGIEGVLTDLLIAQELFQKLGHRQLESTTENNIARLLQQKGDYINAIKHAENSISLAENVGDRRQVGCVYDTLARIAIDCKDYLSAKEYATNAIQTLEQTDSNANLIEAKETKIHALYYLDDIEDMLEVYAQTLILAREKTSSKISKNLTQTVSGLIRKISGITIYAESETDSGFSFINVDIPKRLDAVELKGVEIKTHRLTDVGIMPGDYAIYRVTNNADNHDFLCIENFSENDYIVIQNFDGEIFVGEAHFNLDTLDLHFQGNTFQSFFREDYTLLGQVVGYLPKPLKGKTELLELRRKGKS